MASQKSKFGRTSSQLSAWLAVPRVVTLPVLMVLGLGSGQLFWHFADSVKILAWLSGIASPFCMMCAATVWAMRGHLEDSIEIDAMSSKTYRAFVEIAATHRKRSTTWATFTALAGIVAAFPAVSNQLIGPVWHWMVLLSFTAVAFSAAAYMLASQWEIETRAYKTRQILEGKVAQERTSLLDEIHNSRPQSAGSGWSEGPSLMRSSSHH